MTLRSPGSQESSVLGRPVAGGESGLPRLLSTEHWVTASSQLGLPVLIVERLTSYRPTPVRALCPFLPLSEFTWLHPALVSMPSTVVRMSNGRTAETGTVVIAGP